MMTLDKTIQEKKEMSISKWISDKICSYCNVDKKNYQKMKYGIDIIYINIKQNSCFDYFISNIRNSKRNIIIIKRVYMC